MGVCGVSCKADRGRRQKIAASKRRRDRLAVSGAVASTESWVPPLLSDCLIAGCDILGFRTMHGPYRSPRLPGSCWPSPARARRPEALRGNLARRMHRQVQAQTAGGQADLAKVAGKICQDIRRHVPRAFVPPGLRRAAWRPCRHAASTTDSPRTRSRRNSPVGREPQWHNDGFCL